MELHNPNQITIYPKVHQQRLIVLNLCDPESIWCHFQQLLIAHSSSAFSLALYWKTIRWYVRYGIFLAFRVWSSNASDFLVTTFLINDSFIYLILQSWIMTEFSTVIIVQKIVTNFVTSNGTKITQRCHYLTLSYSFSFEPNFLSIMVTLGVFVK